MNDLRNNTSQQPQQLKAPQPQTPESSCQLHMSLDVARDPASQSSHTSSDALVTSSLLFLVMPGAPSSVLAPSSDALCSY